MVQQSEMVKYKEILYTFFLIYVQRVQDSGTFTQKESLNFLYILT